MQSAEKAAIGLPDPPSFPDQRIVAGLPDLARFRPNLRAAVHAFSKKDWRTILSPLRGVNPGGFENGCANRAIGGPPAECQQSRPSILLNYVRSPNPHSNCHVWLCFRFHREQRSAI